MPTYTFHCLDCEQRWRRNVPSSERNDQRCPTCSSTQVKRPVDGAPSVRIPVEHRSVNYKSRSLNGIDTSTLPFVGKDGKLYSADAKTVIKE